MKVEIVVCDRCGDRVRDEATVAKLSVRRSESATSRELCVLCDQGLTKYLKGAPLADLEAELAEMGKGADGKHALRDARRMANEAIEAWADGASADDLADRLRDIATAAHR